MADDDKNQKTILSRTRFLIVDPEPAIGEGLRRFFMAENAPAVHVAQSPLLALRVLQDRKTPVDCVICAHKPASFSALDFLQNLRTGRWGGLSLQHLKFVILMESRDEAAVAYAEQLHATGFIFPPLTKENVRKVMLKALDPEGPAKAPPNFRVAHMRTAEADLVLALFPASFGTLSAEKQEEALQAVAAGAQAARLSGGVAAIYPTDSGKPAFVAADVYQRFLSRQTIESAEKLLNRAIHVDWIGDDPTVEVAAAAQDAPAAAPPPLAEDDMSDRRRSALKVDKPFKRVLTEDDIRGVALAFKEMGAEEFVQKFVRNQAISLQGSEQPLTPMMREFYVSIETLRASFFPGAEMRGSKVAFQSLTHLLDQLMLRSLPFLPTNGLPASLNLNVHSILTKTFETAIKGAQAELLTFEIPQPMITQHFAEYKKAHELISAAGAKIAVDQIFPDTLGQLDLDQIGTNIAKLHWKGDLKNFSAAHRDSVKRAIDRGVTMVMSRVDDPAAFKIAQEFGIQNFQGFLIDEMAGEAPDGYLPLM